VSTFPDDAPKPATEPRGCETSGRSKFRQGPFGNSPDPVRLNWKFLSRAFLLVVIAIAGFGGAIAWWQSSFRSAYYRATIGGMIFAVEPANAQSLNDHGPEVPRSLWYLFDLPWCRAWNFNCNRCQKNGDTIVCEQTKQGCRENWKLFDCAEIVVPRDCEVWSDGCNVCGRPKGADPGGCTAGACRPYVPRFKCRQWRGETNSP
jgi:hypothetical protein